MVSDVDVAHRKKVELSRCKEDAVRSASDESDERDSSGAERDPVRTFEPLSGKTAD